MERRKRQKTEIRKEQIKKAVFKIISTKGISALSTRNLAKEVGITEGAIFRHYASKKDILKDIMDDVKENLSYVLDTISKKEESASKRLFECLCYQVKYLLEHQGITILLFSEAIHYNDRELRKKMYEIFDMQKKAVEKIIKDGIKSCEFKEVVSPQDISRFYMGIPAILNVEITLNKSKLNTDGFCKRMFVLLSNILSGDNV